MDHKGIKHVISEIECKDNYSDNFPDVIDIIEASVRY